MCPERLSDTDPVVVAELRKATIPMFFDMMQCEFMMAPRGSSRKYKGNFRKVNAVTNN